MIQTLAVPRSASATVVPTYAEEWKSAIGRRKKKTKEKKNKRKDSHSVRQHAKQYICNHEGLRICKCTWDIDHAHKVHHTARVFT